MHDSVIGMAVPTYTYENLPAAEQRCRQRRDLTAAFDQTGFQRRGRRGVQPFQQQDDVPHGNCPTARWTIAFSSQAAAKALMYCKLLRDRPVACCSLQYQRCGRLVRQRDPEQRNPRAPACRSRPRVSELSCGGIHVSSLWTGTPCVPPAEAGGMQGVQGSTRSCSAS